MHGHTDDILAAEMHVDLEASSIRKILKKKGYRWLPRRQKPKYSREDRAARRRFAADILALGNREYRNHFAMPSAVLCVYDSTTKARGHISVEGVTGSS